MMIKERLWCMASSYMLCDTVASLPFLDTTRYIGSRCFASSASAVVDVNNATRNGSRPVFQRPEEYDRLLPCPPHNYQPRIEHLIVEHGGNVVDIISTRLSLPQQYIKDLIHFGSVYYAVRCPTPPASATAEHMELYEKSLQCKPAMKGKTLKDAQRIFRVPNAHEMLQVGAYMRVHVHPKRFPRCYEVDWKSRIIANRASFVVLNKPAGVAVGGTVDNLEESCATFAARALGMRYPLLLTHQIDTCTEGCVVLAKDKEFTSRFHKLLRMRKVEKYYLALATSPVPLGKVSHFMRPDLFAPRVLSKERHKDWYFCELEILECQKLPWPSETMPMQGKYDCKWPDPDYSYEYKIRLSTGRTHQVRAQFAALGAPLVGDTVYMPAALKRFEDPTIDPFLEMEEENNNEDAEKNWLAQHGSEPESAIGLQACSISWEDNDCSFTAGLPWWRQS